jgi:hypothetical protein
MLICVSLRILASLRIPQYDLGRQTPHFWGGSVTDSTDLSCHPVRTSVLAADCRRSSIPRWVVSFGRPCVVCHPDYLLCRPSSHAVEARFHPHEARSSLCTSPQGHRSNSYNSRAASPRSRWVRTPILPSWPGTTALTFFSSLSVPVQRPLLHRASESSVACLSELAMPPMPSFGAYPDPHPSSCACSRERQGKI